MSKCPKCGAAAMIWFPAAEPGEHGIWWCQVCRHQIDDDQGDLLTTNRTIGVSDD